MSVDTLVVVGGCADGCNYSFYICSVVTGIKKFNESLAYANVKMLKTNKLWGRWFEFQTNYFELFQTQEYCAKLNLFKHAPTTFFNATYH